jgi:type II secretory pathway component PulC
VIPDLRSGVQVLAQASSKLVTADDGEKAFQITAITPGSLIDTGGFQPGDILISVNGERVRGNQDAMRLYNRFRGETRFVVVVERGGERRTLFYDLK